MNLRPLSGLRVNLSITCSDSPGVGYSPEQVSRLILQFVSALSGQGARLAFGHDWRKEGVMEKVHGFARQTSGPLPVYDESGESVLLVNLVPWPDRPSLQREERERLRETLRVEEVGLPEELRQAENAALNQPSDSEFYLYMRARGFTHLRRRLNRISNARVCIGGPEKAMGRYPGIVEEGLLALDEEIPLYLSSLLGGVAEQLVDAVLGKRMPDGFASKSRAGKLYRLPIVEEYASNTRQDRTFNPEAVWNTFAERGIKGLSELNRLTRNENEELLQTRVAERVIELVLTGVARLSAEKNPELGRDKLS